MAYIGLGLLTGVAMHYLGKRAGFILGAGLLLIFLGLGI